MPSLTTYLKTINHRKYKASLYIATALALSGCGGSGSNSSTSPAPPSSMAIISSSSASVSSLASSNSSSLPTSAASSLASSSLISTLSSTSSSSATSQASSTSVDSDADGVANNLDLCPGTSAQELVNSQGCSFAQIDSDSDGYSDDIDRCDKTPLGESVNTQGCGTTTETNYTARTFVESDGLVVVEMESTGYGGDWRFYRGLGAIGNGYLVWEGNDLFSTPGTGVININIKIRNPGTYRFIWRNIVSKGDSATEANDSWLKITAENYYARRSVDGEIVCPKGKPTANLCTGNVPDGAGSGGWFKVYRSGAPVKEWKWMARTSDGDPHDIYAVFPTAGDYLIQISGRSNGHGIDRFVLYRDLNATNNVQESFATASARSESDRE